MADSKHDESLLMAAMAWRVKYRKGQNIMVRIESMGVHKQNRGGLYPAGIRVKSMCVDVLEVGFLKEEVNHLCIAEEEAPVKEVIRMGGDGTENASSYNEKTSCKDALLSTCFQAPYNDVRLTLLSHNHMMLVLRAFLTRAQWDIPPDRGLTLCDSDGRLSVTAVAESINGKELAEVLAEGLQVGLLSWQMDAEESTAVSIISQALNLPHQMGMPPDYLEQLFTHQGKHAMATVATLKKWQCGWCKFPRTTTQIPDPTMYTLNHFIMPHCEKCRKVTKNPIWWEQKVSGMWRRVRPYDFTDWTIAKWWDRVTKRLLATRPYKV